MSLKKASRGFVGEEVEEVEIEVPVIFKNLKGNITKIHKLQTKLIKVKKLKGVVHIGE